MADPFFQELFDDARGYLLRDTTPEIGFGGYIYDVISGYALLSRIAGFGAGISALNAATYGVIADPPPLTSPTGIAEFEATFQWRTNSTMSSSTGTQLQIVIYGEDPTNSSLVSYCGLECLTTSGPQLSIYTQADDSGLLPAPALADATVYDIKFKASDDELSLTINDVLFTTLSLTTPVGEICGLYFITGGDAGIGPFSLSSPDSPPTPPAWTGFQNTYEVL